MKRSQPLTDVESQEREAEVQFNVIWGSEAMEEWEDSRMKAPANDAGDGGIWCAACE